MGSFFTLSLLTLSSERCMIVFFPTCHLYIKPWRVFPSSVIKHIHSRLNWQKSFHLCVVIYNFHLRCHTNWNMAEVRKSWRKVPHNALRIRSKFSARELAVTEALVIVGRRYMIHTVEGLLNPRKAGFVFRLWNSSILRLKSRFSPWSNRRAWLEWWADPNL